MKKMIKKNKKDKDKSKDKKAKDKHKKDKHKKDKDKRDKRSEWFDSLGIKMIDYFQMYIINISKTTIQII